MPTRIAYSIEVDPHIFVPNFMNTNVPVNRSGHLLYMDRSMPKSSRLAQSQRLPVAVAVWQR